MIRHLVGVSSCLLVLSVPGLAGAQCDDVDGCAGECEEHEPCGNGHCAPYCGECGSPDTARCIDCFGAQGRERCPCDPAEAVDGVCHFCGDGLVWAGNEECDDENNVDGDGCDSNCRWTGCPNGIVTGDEVCDDGNEIDGDDCDSNCTEPACGNGITSVDGDGQDEECDDGNDMDGDGCDSNCTVSRCGNGVVSIDENGEPERCDDGNEVNTDACVACELARCGDGFVQNGLEACDDGNLNNADECTDRCALPLCGDGEVQPPEECDDGNDNNVDACRDNCLRPCGDEECVCSLLSTVTPKLSVSIKVPPGDANAIEFDLTLPKLGKVGTTFNFEFNAEGQTANCKNDCTASFGGGAKGMWSVTVLTEEVTAEIGGELMVTEKLCEICDLETCQEDCGERTCLTQGGGGSAAMAYTRTFPLFPERSFNWGPVSGKLGCKLTAGFGLNLGGSVTHDRPGQSELCEVCGACKKTSATVGGNVNGSLGCALGLQAGSVNGSGSVTGVATIAPQFTYDNESGAACENPGLCAHAKVTATVGGSGTLCVNLRFFNAKASCNVSYTGSAEAGCKGFSSSGTGPEYGCSVSATQSSDCTKPCEKICRRGVACGDACIAAGRRCTKPPGKACQGPPPEMAL
jgi:cysteine-rich repeat protein